MSRSRWGGYGCSCPQCKPYKTAGNVHSQWDGRYSAREQNIRDGLDEAIREVKAERGRAFASDAEFQSYLENL